MNFLATFLQLRPEGWGVLLGLMLPLTLFFLTLTVRVRADVRRERALLAALQARTRAVLATDPDDRPESEDTVEDLRSAISSAPPRSVVRRAFEAAAHARALATPNLAAVADALGAANDARLSGVRNIPNLLMLAGLLGTVLGLAESIASLAPQIARAAQATEPTQLAQALGSTMQTMRGAFGSSLWGITLSLLGALWLSGTAREVERLGDDLCEFVLAELMPAVFPRALEGQIERMVRFLKGAGDTFHALHTNLEQVATTFDTVLTTAGSTLKDSLDGLQTTSAQVREVFTGINASVDTLSGKLADGARDLAAAQDIATRTLREAHTDLGGQLRKQSGQIGELQQRFADDAARILAGVQDVNDALGRTTRTFAETTRTYEDGQRRHLDRLDSGLQEVGQQLGRHVQDNREALSAALAVIGEREPAAQGRN